MDVVQEVKSVALEYIVATGGVKHVIETCEKLSQEAKDNELHKLPFTVHIEPSDLINRDVELGNLVLNNKVEARQVFQEVTFELLQKLSLLIECKSSDQIIITFKISSLPSLPEYVMKSVRDLTLHAQSQRFLQFRGVITGLSVPHNYTQSARYICPDPECPGSTGSHFIRHHVPGAREDQVTGTSFTCTYCDSFLDEDVICRSLEDCTIVELVEEEAFTNPGQRYQSICAYLRGSLATGREIGEVIEIISVPVHNPFRQCLVLEVNNFVDTEPLSNYVSPELFPPAIQILYAEKSSSSWSFGLTLAIQFGGHITPPGTYLHFKLGLLLSLLECSESQGPPAHILTVANDLLVVDRLLQYAASLSERFVHHHVQNRLLPTVVKDRHSSVVPFIEGGSLLLANGGICILSELGDYKSSLRADLMRVLDSNTIRVDVAPSAGCEGQQLLMPLRCRVWASTHQSHAKVRQDTILNPYQIYMEGSASTIASFFGMVYFAEMKPDTYAEYTSVHQTLLNAMGHGYYAHITHEDFRQTLALMRKKKTNLGTEAEQLLKGYYIAARRVRANSGTGTVPQNAVATITSLALSHAKLHLRPLASEDDALMAILLYEESATYRYGNSVLNQRPLQHIPDNDFEAYIGKKCDLQIRTFHKNLKQFIMNHASDESFCEE